MKESTEPEFFSKQVAQARRFYMEQSTTKDARIKVICGGCEHTAQNFEINRKDFPYYCIEFVARGSGVVILNNQQYELKPGMFFSYGPGISQRIKAVPETPMVKYFVDFTGSSINHMFKKNISPLGTAIQVHRTEELMKIFEELLTQGLSDSPFKSFTCSALLEYLLYRVADMLVREEDNLSRAFLTYQTSREYIKNNFKVLNSLQDIADICAIDQAYLCRLFKRFDTQSPYKYLLNVKMSYAASRFQKTDVLVKSMAYELGFSDPFHFTRIFKRLFGISPQAFKNLR